MGNLHKRYIQKMVTVKYLLTLIILSTFANACVAVDNPEAPNHLSSLESQEALFLDKINNPDNGYRANLIAYDDYLTFLDKQLNAIYKDLVPRLNEEQKNALKLSQREWIKYRDLEFALIQDVWNKSDFGSSSAISRGQYKASIVRDRVIQLIHYSKSL